MLTLCLLGLSSLAAAATEQPITVETSSGRVAGQQVAAREPRTGAALTYARFPTIPFARPPLGDLRFAPPQPLEPGEVVDTSNVTATRMCFQLDDLFGLLPAVVDAAEDCLYLYVYVPGVWPPPKPLPVMIWFTGGAFVLGSGNWYGPELWMPHDILLVTVNYRLGPFGFLTLGLEEAPGNQGLLDQRLAMLWVRDNIASFMGDPDQVTIAGESAGSFSVFYHMMSPGSQGLYHRIIGQSGMAALAPSFHHWAGQQGVRLGRELALLLGCWSLDPRQELACLRQQSPFALQAAELDNGIISQPVVDWDYAAQPFLPQDPLLALENGDFNTDVEILLGTNKNEGLLITQIILFADNLFFNTMINYWDLWGPLLLFHKHALEITEEDSAKAHEVLEHYCGTQNVTEDHIANITEMFTDSFFLYGVTKYIDDYHLRYSSKPVYHYINSYHNDNHQVCLLCFPPFSAKLPGVSHADELFLQWSPLVFLPFALSENDTVTSLHITTMWADFVKHGSPGGGWTPVEADSKTFLNLNIEPRMETRDEHYDDRIAFWRSIYPY